MSIICPYIPMETPERYTENHIESYNVLNYILLIMIFTLFFMVILYSIKPDIIMKMDGNDKVISQTKILSWSLLLSVAILMVYILL